MPRSQGVYNETVDMHGVTVPTANQRCNVAHLRGLKERPNDLVASAAAFSRSPMLKEAATNATSSA